MIAMSDHVFAHRIREGDGANIALSREGLNPYLG